MTNYYYNYYYTPAAFSGKRIM